MNQPINPIALVKKINASPINSTFFGIEFKAQTYLPSQQPSQLREDGRTVKTNNPNQGVLK